VRQEKIRVAGYDYLVTHIPTATLGGSWYVVHDACEMWAAVSIGDLDGEIIGWRNPPDEKYKAELEKAVKDAFGIPMEP